MPVLVLKGTLSSGLSAQDVGSHNGLSFEPIAIGVITPHAPRGDWLQNQTSSWVQNEKQSLCVRERSKMKWGGSREHCFTWESAMNKSFEIKHQNKMIACMK